MNSTFSAFGSSRMIASGELQTVLLQVKAELERQGGETILIFEDQSGRQVDFDLRGSNEEVLSRLKTHPHLASSQEAEVPRAGPGRPRLGVVSREVSLLPRHWEWLENKPQGASATLRRLVEDARRKESGPDQAKQAREAVSRVMWSLAGNLPDFEEASRALFAGDLPRLTALMTSWPSDFREYLLGRLAQVPVLEPPTATQR